MVKSNAKLQPGKRVSSTSTKSSKNANKGQTVKVKQAHVKEKVKKKKLVPLPEGQIGRSGMKLQNLMGLAANSVRYKCILELCRPIIGRRLDVTKTMNRQNKANIELTVREMVQTVDLFRDFQDNWPCRHIIKSHLQNHSSTHKKAVKAERIARRMDTAGIAEKDREEAGGKTRSSGYSSPVEDVGAEESDREAEDEEEEESSDEEQPVQERAQNVKRSSVSNSQVSKVKPKPTKSTTATKKVKTMHSKVLDTPPSPAPAISPRKAKGKAKATIASLSSDESVATNDEYVDEGDNAEGNSNEFEEENENAILPPGPSTKKVKFPVERDASDKLKTLSKKDVQDIKQELLNEPEDVQTPDFDAQSFCWVCNEPFPDLMPKKLATLMRKQSAIVNLHGPHSSEVWRIDMEICPQLKETVDEDMEFEFIQTQADWFNAASEVHFNKIPDRVINFRDDLLNLTENRTNFTNSRGFRLLLMTYGTEKDIRTMFCHSPQAQALYHQTQIPPGFYGPYGEEIINTILLYMFPRGSFEDAVIRPLDHIQVIQYILVPEVLTRLMVNDLDPLYPDELKRWELLRISARWGKMRYDMDDDDAEFDKIHRYIHEIFSLDAEGSNDQPQSSNATNQQIVTMNESKEDVEIQQVQQTVHFKDRRKLEKVKSIKEPLRVEDFHHRLPPHPIKRKNEGPNEEKRLVTTGGGISGRPSRNINAPTKFDPSDDTPKKSALKPSATKKRIAQKSKVVAGPEVSH
ncbi:hypothetical protein BT96DRAFT_945720 [Gymnopus androsaceus JB14]|uniref:Restriction of telomere capping protein 4 C-terminal domain-containing protein n=1 Tax=Gymnopus androsaceus JB14 TaxID=1447944 RepID=A0A6A4GZX3_9AGAR|nr:hypothetical protein BT96DRAFT_945720 [Gymnopus androsaceus JB14]